MISEVCPDEPIVDLPTRPLCEECDGPADPAVDEPLGDGCYVHERCAEGLADRTTRRFGG